MRQLHLPVNSYRLQFGAPLGFAAARRLLPYLDALGVTDCYASPLLKAATGSTHGYDICDHGLLNPELGSESEFEDFTEALRQRQMGLVLDFVPNHMGLDASANPWWHDVLQHGKGSSYADYFDIDWDAPEPEVRGRVLLPILQDGYGDVLHRGELQVGYEDGSFYLQYFARRLPIEPGSSAAILRTGLTIARSGETAAGREYLDIAALLDMLPPVTSSNPVQRAGRRQISRLAQKRLARLAQRSSLVCGWIEQALETFAGTPGQPATFDRLHDLLEQQPYRLAHWRTAFDEINYRRFFDVNDLGGIRMEDPRVFEAAHRRIRQWVADGRVTGLRIDHPDGLLDPSSYFARLDREMSAALSAHHHESGQSLYVVAEKILAHGEFLPEDWPVAGTTGYGFLNAVNGLFVDTENGEAFRDLYAAVTGRSESFADVEYHSKRLVMGSSMASELAVLARALKTIADSDRRTRDFTVTALRKAIVEVVASLPVYRTYVRTSGFSSSDRERIDFAVDRARSRNPVISPTVFLFLRSVLLAEGDERSGPIQSRRHFAMKFQQFSVPVHAKGVEDTSFYRANALVSLNEVGGDPGRFGTSLDEFHAGNRVRLERWPRELLATATHDTKRGEDARARLNVLSEIPARWWDTVSEWQQRNAVHRTAVDRRWAPDANDEYLFYQTLIASWPAEALDAPIPPEADPELVGRLRAYMQKAIREAKTHTSWINQNGAYEDAVARFVDTTLSGSAGHAFLTAALPFIRTIARGGMVNSLAQLTLKMTAPGVPDIYQGTETWQLDMADPDNRRAVDFAQREAMLCQMMPWIARAESLADTARAGSDHRELEHYVRELVANWRDGRIKLFATACALRLRRREPSLFIEGRYEALRGDGPAASNLATFARIHGTKCLIAAVPRLVNERFFQAPTAPTDPGLWQDTRLFLPPGGWAGFRHLFTGAWLQPDPTGESVLVDDLFRTCPVAILIGEQAPTE